MDDKITFGQFVRRKRIEADYTLRGFALATDISPVYMSNIETDRRAAPTKDKLDKMAKLLRLSEEEALFMYDLAAASKNNAVSQDLPDYIMRHDLVRVALRTARDVDATDEEWLEFIEKLKKRDLEREGKTDE
jgi:transcriptional regulator with XRE-family HTH domain